VKSESEKRHSAGKSGPICLPLARNDTVPKRHNVPVFNVAWPTLCALQCAVQFREATRPEKSSPSSELSRQSLTELLTRWRAMQRWLAHLNVVVASSQFAGGVGVLSAARMHSLHTARLRSGTKQLQTRAQQLLPCQSKVGRNVCA